MLFKPYTYQEECIKRMTNDLYLGLFLDMGLGKTVITLTAIAELIQEKKVHDVLVIAPKRVAESTWSQEVNKWEHLKHLKVSKILGGKRGREKAVNQDADIYIINRENVTWLVETQEWKWDCVIIDELSSFKSQKSKRFRSLRSVLPKIKRIYGLTGTPAPNGYLDLWSQIYLLDRGRALGTSREDFKSRYFVRINSHLEFESNKNYKLKSARAREVMIKRLEDFCIYLKADDYIELPEIIYNTFEVVLEPKILKQYKSMEREYFLELGDSEITALSAGTITTKLLQIATGQVYDESKNIHQIHTEKLEVLKEIIEAARDEAILVFYNFQHERDLILENFDARVLKEDQDVIDWNAGKIKLLLAHPASAAYGLNMQSGGHIIVWYSPTWNLEQYEQANARLHRQGQGKPVRVIHLIAKDTIDESVMRALESKDQAQSVLLKALQKKLDEVRQNG